jgi:hypothetical protein
MTLLTDPARLTVTVMNLNTDIRRIHARFASEFGEDIEPQEMIVFHDPYSQCRGWRSGNSSEEEGNYSERYRGLRLLQTRKGARTARRTL